MLVRDQQKGAVVQQCLVGGIVDARIRDGQETRCVFVQIVFQTLIRPYIDVTNDQLIGRADKGGQGILGDTGREVLAFFVNAHIHGGSSLLLLQGQSASHSRYTNGSRTHETRPASSIEALWSEGNSTPELVCTRQSTVGSRQNAVDSRRTAYCRCLLSLTPRSYPL